MQRTLENCTLIQKCVRKGIGGPEQRNGKCMGYQKSENDDQKRHQNGGNIFGQKDADRCVFRLHSKAPPYNIFIIQERREEFNLFLRLLFRKMSVFYSFFVTNPRYNEEKGRYCYEVRNII